MRQKQTNRRHRHRSDRRGQYFSMDAILGALIFSVAVSIIFFHYSAFSNLPAGGGKDAMLQNGLRASSMLMSKGDDLSAITSTTYGTISKLGLGAPTGGNDHSLSLKQAGELRRIIGYSGDGTLNSGAYAALRSRLMIDGYYEYMIKIERLNSPLDISMGKSLSSGSGISDNIAVVKRQVVLFNDTTGMNSLGTISVYIWN